MIKPHQGSVQLFHSFDRAWNYLKKNGCLNLNTSVGTNFKACAGTTRDNRKVIRFFQKRNKEKEYARAYECCWGHYYNCNRTRVGMYLKALDKVLP